MKARSYVDWFKVRLNLVSGLAFLLCMLFAVPVQAVNLTPSTTDGGSGGGSGGQPMQNVGTQTNRVNVRVQAHLIGNRNNYNFRPGPGGGFFGGQGTSQIPGGDAPLAYDLSAGQSGLSAGDGQSVNGLWLSNAFSILGSAKKSEKFNGTSYVVMAGYDRKVLDQLALGLSLGYEHTALNTEFNSGSLTSNGFTIAPYLAFNPFEFTVIDLSGGFSLLSHSGDERGRSNYVYTSFRSMLNANITQYFVLGNWCLSANGGFLYAYDAAYTDRADNAQIGDLSLGGRVSYIFDRVEPYLSVVYLYDTLADPDTDSDEFEGTIGLNFAPTDSLRIGVEASNSFFRDLVNNTRFLANIRYEF